MSPWVQWCVNHKLKWLVVLLFSVYAPFHIICYIPEALEDLKYGFSKLLELKETK